MVLLVLAEPQLDLLRGAGDRRLRAAPRAPRDEGLDRTGQGQLRDRSGDAARGRLEQRGRRLLALRGALAGQLPGRARGGRGRRPVREQRLPPRDVLVPAVPGRARPGAHRRPRGLPRPPQRAHRRDVLQVGRGVPHPARAVARRPGRVATVLWREAYESGVKPGVRPEAYQELLWFDPTAPASRRSSLPTSRYFPDLGLVVGRTSWAEDATLVSFKASPGGGHKAWETSHRIDPDDGLEHAQRRSPPPRRGHLRAARSRQPTWPSTRATPPASCTHHHNGVLVDGHGFVNENRYHVYKDLPEHQVARIRSTLL